MAKATPPPADFGELNVEWTPLDAVQRHPDNYREGDVGAISTSLDRWGWYAPLVVQRSSGRIVVGNHRWEAAKRRGETHVPVHYRDLTDEQALALLAADNRMSDLARNDVEQLGAVLRHLAQIDELEGTGYSGDDVDELLASIEGVPPEGHGAQNLDEQYAVIVTCENEDDQRTLLAELEERGLTVRAAVI